MSCQHGWPLNGGDVIALTLDGIGMRETGELWGGESLGRLSWRRTPGGLPAVALAGDDVAAKQPWRYLLAPCLRLFLTGSVTGNIWALQQNSNVLARAIAGINAPLASSCGRLFDAVPPALHCASPRRYEGEAACALEALASQCRC
ncbi:hypothetical protein ACNKHK_17455 [Shigella flexneri]